MIGITLAAALSGCGANKGNAEAEELRRQIAQLEQKVSELESRNNSYGYIRNGADDRSESADAQTAPSLEGGSADAIQTTHTMDELTDMVNSFVEKADAASPKGSVSESTEQFFALKQEEKQIDRCLDIHEDELESLYHAGSITRDEYRLLERELEALEDRLDDAEDRLEYIFGIDD